MDLIRISSLSGHSYTPYTTSGGILPDQYYSAPRIKFEKLDSEKIEPIRNIEGKKREKVSDNQIDLFKKRVR
jgi:hypothetical protein